MVTKLDLMDPGTDAAELLQNRVVPLRRGYVGVVNRGQRDVEKRTSVSQALDNELKFFKVAGCWCVFGVRCDDCEALEGYGRRALRMMTWSACECMVGEPSRRRMLPWWPRTCAPLRSSATALKLIFHPDSWPSRIQCYCFLEFVLAVLHRRGPLQSHPAYRTMLHRCTTPTLARFACCISRSCLSARFHLFMHGSFLGLVGATTESRHGAPQDAESNPHAPYPGLPSGHQEPHHQHDG